MSKRSIYILLSLVLVVGLSTSCILDPKEKVDDGGGGKKVEFKDLTHEDDVLFNLELAYNERRMDEYDRLLDDKFTFILSEADYNSGEVDVPQWDRVREVSVNSQILNPNLAGDLRVVSIDLSLDYPADNWTEQPANEDHPGESWYVKTVDYDLVVKTADEWEHRALGLQAQFTIRKAQTEEGEYWRIVLWRDDVGNPVP